MGEAKRKALSQKQFAVYLKKVFPEIEERNGYIILPSLKRCRELFDEYTGIKHKWPSDGAR